MIRFRDLLEQTNYLINRETFLGNPKITSNRYASELVPKASKSAESLPFEPFMNNQFQIKRYDNNVYSKYVIFDKNIPIASYDGNVLVVLPKYRGKGIATELVVDFRTRHPEVKPASTRTKTSQHIQMKAWDIIQQRKQKNS